MKDSTHCGYRLIPRWVSGWRLRRLHVGIALSRSRVFHTVSGKVSGVTFAERVGIALRFKGCAAAVYVERQTGSQTFGAASTEIALAVPQQPLPADAAKVLKDNLWDLISDAEPQPVVNAVDPVAEP